MPPTAHAFWGQGVEGAGQRGEGAGGRSSRESPVTLSQLFTEAFWQTNNILFTSLPIIIFGVNEMDMPKEVAASQPRAYTVGIRQTRYTHTKFSGWMVEAFYTAALCTFMPIFSFGWHSSPGETCAARPPNSETRRVHASENRGHTRARSLPPDP